MHWLSLALVASQALTASSSSSFPVKLETKSRLNSRLANVHVSVERQVEGPVKYTYGSCSGTESRDAHHVIGQSASASTSRLVWVLPENVKAGGCISAWDARENLIGRSEAQQLQVRKRGVGKRSAFSIHMDNTTGIDTLGAWFDGVELLQGKDLGPIDVAKAKSKEVAILGAGMSGLLTFLILQQSGFTNISLIEASQRLGGRVHTEYLSGGPFDYSYQEMGPMRFPFTYTSGNETYNITDHQLVFQLADEMNQLNNYDKNLSVDFIPWLQSNDNGFYYHNGIKLDTGLPPTIKQVAENPSLSIELPLDASTQAVQGKVNAILNNETFMIEMATNMHKAHKDFIVNGLNGLGGDMWSGFAYLANYLGASLNDTDIVAAGYEAESFWGILYDNLYFGATAWKTIDGGLNRLPLSFHPLVDNATTMNTKVERIQWLEESQKLNVQWRHNYTDRVFQNATFDYVFLAIPPPQLKKLRLPTLPATISNAIQNVPFASACKVALEFKTRFWQHYENPIYGGQSDTDIAGIGSINYPSYCLNCTGPASMLASYVTGDWADIWVAVPEEEHVQYVIDAMTEIHGAVVTEQYTRNYNRRCWRMDEYEGGGWASPTIGQHQLYIPEYFKTYSNMIFIGEHTSYTHAWITSALESGVRGSVQLLLELGLIDEAKAAVDKWMGRWIDV
ncbi:flavin-containing amine oxidoreductase [Biscogniauxia marginata]|nr:flavin-containing amine oxidoreductase [Biscogniauxia marginata]